MHRAQSKTTMNRIKTSGKNFMVQVWFFTSQPKLSDCKQIPLNKYHYWEQPYKIYLISLRNPCENLRSPSEAGFHDVFTCFLTIFFSQKCEISCKNKHLHYVEKQPLVKFIRNYTWDASGVLIFHTPTGEVIVDAISRFFVVVCDCLHKL